MVVVSETYEGRQDSISDLKLPIIEVFEDKYQEVLYHDTLTTDELTAVCPKTGLPDLYKMTLIYSPNKWIAELKSFKLYLAAFRNVGIFHEHLANKILEDFKLQVEPSCIHLILRANNRGGIVTTVERDDISSECPYNGGD